MSQTKNVRNLGELGRNMQKIVNRLLANDNLVNLLYYTDKDPLSQDALTETEKNTEIFNKLIKMVPRLDPTETAKSVISIFAASGTELGENGEFTDITIIVETFVPITQWFIKDSNLRPYAIMGEVQSSLNGKTINGLGRIKGGDFDYNFGSDEMTSFIQTFHITNYD